MHKTKGATPWAAVRAEKLQVSIFLPNDQPMKKWFATVHGLPAAWPDLSMIGPDNMKKVTARDLQDLRVRYQVSSMWGTISPNWDLLHLAKGPGYYTVADREEWLFNNRSNRPGDDLKDDVCAATATEAWQFWTAQKDRFVKLRQPGPVLVFPTETAVLDPLFQQVRREEELLSLNTEAEEPMRLGPEEPREGNRRQKHLGSHCCLSYSSLTTCC